jgi:hypothetical protein
MKPRQWAFHTFRSPHWDLLPTLAVGRNPGAWGYPTTIWIGWGWLRRSQQLSIYLGKRLPVISIPVYGPATQSHHSTHETPSNCPR